MLMRDRRLREAAQHTLCSWVTPSKSLISYNEKRYLLVALQSSSVLGGKIT